MIRWRLVLIGGLAGVAALAAVESGRAVLAATASQVAAPPTAAIAGRVVDGVTGRPIAGVTITVTMVSPPLVARPEWDAAARQAAAAARRRSVQTDVDGRFATDGQPSGTFLVLANGSAVGYLAGIPGQQTPRGAGRGSVTLQAGERRTDLAIKLWRGGSISGVIQDDRGEPLVKAAVHVLRRQYLRGQPVLSGFPTRTDDRGVFRRTGLVPGDYVVALGRFSATTPGPEARDFGTVYYGGSRSALTAAIVNLAPGEDRRGIDIIASLGPRLVTVSGRLTGDESPAATRVVRLVPRGTPPMFAELEELIAPADQTGRFAFADIPAGDYQLLTWHLPLSPDGVRITSNLQTEGRSGRAPEGSPLPLLPDAPTLVASMAISAEKPVADLIVPLAPGARFSGRVVFDGLVGPPPASLLAAAPVRVTEAHGRTLSVPVSGIREDGRFETVGLPPGRYILEVASSSAGAGWSAFFPRPMAMASLRAGGEERIGLGLEIGTADVTDIVMTLTSRRWHLSGLLRGPDGRAAVAAHVVVFPRDRACWADVGFDAPHLLHLATTDRSGRFQLEGAIGGDYLAAAMTAPAEFWMAPEYLETFVPFATPVRLELDGTQTIELRLR